ncbi:CidA/LrgA family protein [Thalassotalea atypica]|uniref:CidA/LrgA family protein n=1 Tax=Thalassotalea atypica TaxID=2054316 RepID=UPI002572C252|nr:CidA/LrgA family protein [Thalassotalea atypica]
MNRPWSLSNIVNHLYSVFAIGGSLAVGYGINMIVTLIPPSLIGMIVLATGLKLNWIDAEKLKATIAWIIKHMGVCFVPAGVGVMEHFNLLKHDGPVMLLLAISSTLLLMFIVGWLYQRHTLKGQ